jgi:hypothetical protein
MKWWLYPIMGFTVVGSSATNGHADGGDGVVFSAPPPQRLHVSSDTTNYVLLPAVPQSRCRVHLAGEEVDVRVPQLFADESGVIPVQLTARTADTTVTSLDVDCVDHVGAATKHRVEITNGGATGPDVYRDRDAFARGWKARHPHWAVRPPLAPSHYGASPDILTQAGYRPRPDPARAPAAYKAWVESVSHPATVAPSVIIPNNDIVHQTNQLAARPSAVLNNIDNDHWSGVVATGDRYRYHIAEGQWTVPFVGNFRFGEWESTSFWVGIGGYPSSALMQTGTSQLVVPIGANWSLCGYYAWAEYAPAPENGLANFPVIPGYSIFAFVTASFNNNDQAVLTLEEFDASGNLYMVTVNFLDKPSGASFDARSVEWIAELPYSTLHPYALSNYGSVVFTNASYWDTGFSNDFHHFNDADAPGTLSWITMWNYYNGDKLSSPQQNGATGSFQCNWYNYN